MSLRNLLPGLVGSQSGATGSDPPPSHSRFFGWEQHVEHELWIVVVVAMVADILLTVHGLQIGLKELNPVARQALEFAGVFGLFVLKGMALLVGVCCRPLIPDRMNVVIPLGLAIPSVCAVLINTTIVVAIYL